MVGSVALAAALAGSTLADADGQTLDDARRQREATLQEKARTAEQLNVLGARETELRRALAGLDDALAYQAARVETAGRAVRDAEAAAAARAREADEGAIRVDELRRRAADAVVEAYVGAAGRDSGMLLAADDVHQVVQRRSLLHLLNGNLRDDLDRLRVLVEDQRRAEASPRAAVAEAERVRVDLAAAQSELARQRDAEARLEEALRASIADWQARADQLTHAEQQLDDVIRQRQADEEASAAAAAAATQAAAAATPASSAPEEPAGGGSRSVSLGTASASGFAYPADAEITSSFGWRRHPILGTSRLHAGIDFGAASGSDVGAAKAGLVIFAGWNGGYGNCVMIEHDGGIVTLYGHMSRLYVSEGETVERGTVVGAVGSTGMSTGPHLHFETRVGGEPEDPLLFLD